MRLTKKAAVGSLSRSAARKDPDIKAVAPNGGKHKGDADLGRTLGITFSNLKSKIKFSNFNPHFYWTYHCIWLHRSFVCFIMSSSSESDNDPIICFKEQTQYTAFDYREKLSLNADEIRHTRELFEMIEEKSLFIMSNIAFLVDSK